MCGAIEQIFHLEQTRTAARANGNIVDGPAMRAPGSGFGTAFCAILPCGKVVAASKGMASRNRNLVAAVIVAEMAGVVIRGVWGAGGYFLEDSARSVQPVPFSRRAGQDIRAGVVTQTARLSRSNIASARRDRRPDSQRRVRDGGQGFVGTETGGLINGGRSGCGVGPAPKFAEAEEACALLKQRRTASISARLKAHTDLARRERG